MHIKSFFDKQTATFSYVVSSPVEQLCVIIDPVLNFELSTGILTTSSADDILNYIRAQELKVSWILETHIHADHLTAAGYLKESLGCKVAIGSLIVDVLEHWVPVFNTFDDTPLDGSQFDKLLKEGDVLKVGSLNIEVLHTPGHTPDSISYKIGNAIFVGDTLFMPYVGTARCDFPGGDVKAMYKTARKLLSYPDDTRLFMCHDYPPAGSSPGWETTVGAQKKQNILINETILEPQYVELRRKRDKSLSSPALLLPAIQFNLRAGFFSQAESNGKQYLKIPIK